MFFVIISIGIYIFEIYLILVVSNCNAIQSTDCHVRYFKKLSIYLSMQHIASSVYLLRKGRRRVELSSSVLLQTLGKLKSLQGTELSVVVVICVRIVLNFNFGFKVLTDGNKRSEML